MTPCRLIVDPPQEGAWNMALDEALLEEAAAGGNAALRFYQWREPTLSLGYFQSYQERYSHTPSRDAAIVRRLSGGGALLHDRELTYSLCLPATHPLARESTALYEVAHRAIIEVAAASLVNLSLYDDHPPEAADERHKAFLCYARRTEFDVVLPTASGANAKIVGSAQRRRRGAVLQHGSILLNASSAAPEFSGLNDLSRSSLTPESLTGPLQKALVEALQLDPVDRPPSAELLKTAQQLQSEKYADRTWIRRR